MLAMRLVSFGQLNVKLSFLKFLSECWLIGPLQRSVSLFQLCFPLKPLVTPMPLVCWLH